jgi:alkylation response protein AidB-like acyl-CoA dehydrogenase
MSTSGQHHDDEHRQLQQTLRLVLAPSTSASSQIAALDQCAPADPELWTRLSIELDLLGLATPAEFGGTGAPLSFLGIVLSELGRALYSGPYFSTVVLAGQALLASGDHLAEQDLLPRIVQGKLTAGLAGLALGTDGLMAAEGVRATRGPDGWQLDGRAEDVWNGCEADLLIVLAAADHGTMCFAVDRDAQGQVRTANGGMDLTRRSAQIDFAGAPARPLGAFDAGQRVLDHLRVLVPTCLAAELVGIAEHCVDVAVRYALQREQFGRQIGSFQAVKHQLVNAYMDNEAAKCATSYALRELAISSPEAVGMSHVAKAAASDAAYKSAGTMIQTLGGIGYTWEHPAHLYLRRAVAGRAAFGSPSAHRRALLAGAVGSRG